MSNRDEPLSHHTPDAKPKLQKVTLYVRPEPVVKLEEIQLQERRRTGRRPDKSELVQQALDLLIERYASLKEAV